MLTGPVHCFKPKKGTLKQRRCLRCDALFQSVGPHNRRCKLCEAWSGSEECPYSEGNYLYALTGEDADTIQLRRQQNAQNAKHLHKGKQ